MLGFRIPLVRCEALQRIRAATVGDSRNHLSDARLAIFRERYGDLILRLGYEVR